MNKKSQKIFLLLYLFLVVFQISTTNIREAYTYTPHQIDLQIQRMNKYPPSLAKVGYIMEVKNEIQLLEKLERNFFFAIDFTEYFPARLPYVLFPLFLVGFYLFVKDRNDRKALFYSFLASILLLTLIGQHAKHGPVLIMPYLIFFIALGFLKLIKLKQA